MKSKSLLFCILISSNLFLSCQTKMTSKPEPDTNKVISNENTKNTRLNANISSNDSQNTQISVENSTETVSYKGKLKSDGKQSTILYLGEESGDLAGFCFMNDSEVGKKILAECNVGELCEFNGEVDWSKSCPFGDGMFSAEAEIISIKSVKKILK